MVRYSIFVVRFFQQKMGNIIFENVYDTYSPMLYGIALGISATKKEAGEILIHTFKEMYQQDLIKHKHPSLCIALIKLIIQTAFKRINADQLINNFRLNQVENTSVFHGLLYKQIYLVNTAKKIN